MGLICSEEETMIEYPTALLFWEEGTTIECHMAPS